jgi:Zn-dependent protease with chaperone function
MNTPMPLWAMCRYLLGMVLPEATMLWLAGLTRAALAIMLIHGVVILWRRLRQNHHFVTRLNAAAITPLPIRLNRLCIELGLAPNMVVLETPSPLAFCYGLLKPRICLSTGLLNSLNDIELKAVLLHETHHCRHYDPLRTLLANVLAATFFLLPAVAEWRDMFLSSVELMADRHAIHRIGRPPLAGAMYKLLKHPLAIQFAPGITGINTFNANQARLVQLLDDAPISPSFSAYSVVVSSLILTLGCVFIQLISF